MFVEPMECIGAQKRNCGRYACFCTHNDNNNNNKNYNNKQIVYYIYAQ